MQKPRHGIGALDSSTDKVGAGIVLFSQTPEQAHKRLWQRICRNTRSPETQQLVDEQLRRIAEHAGNNVVPFQGGVG